jgi:outer membrane protein assembly factor BamB
MRCLLWSCVLVGLAGGSAWADEWPTFRGSNRTGVAPDKGLLTKWPEGGPKLLWQAKGAGRGYSSLAIAGGKIFTLGDGPTGASDKDEYLLAFDLASGKPAWQTKTGPAWNEGPAPWQSSRSTPTVDGDRVYALTAQGKLACAQTADGKILWQKDLKSDFGGNKADGWGYSESVLIDGDRLICTPGGDKATVVALNKQTGELVWKTSREGDRGAGHSSIVITQIGDVKVYVQTTGSGPLGIRASDGKLLWQYPIDRTTAVIPTPICQGDLVYFVCGYGRGACLLKQVAEGDGGVKIEEKYGLKSNLGNKHGGVVLLGDFIYGDSEDQGVPQCVELLTGESKWKSRGSGKGSAAVTAADGHLYVHFQDGTLALVKADPSAYTEVGSFKVPGSGERPSWTQPVIVDGRLYVREQDALLCYDVKNN